MSVESIILGKSKFSIMQTSLAQLNPIKLYHSKPNFGFLYQTMGFDGDKKLRINRKKGQFWG